MDDCLFCKMIAGEIPCEKVFETDEVLGFKDIYPQAHTHLLFIHKEHSPNVNRMSAKQIGEVYAAIKEYTEEGLVEAGFRVVTNFGSNAGQTVFHTHFHVVGGEKLGSFGS
jgi:histidine triad (HIT) family protein